VVKEDIFLMLPVVMVDLAVAVEVRLVVELVTHHLNLRLKVIMEALAGHLVVVLMQEVAAVLVLLATLIVLQAL
jgi:hypothetical protein